MRVKILADYKYFHKGNWNDIDVIGKVDIEDVNCLENEDYKLLIPNIQSIKKTLEDKQLKEFVDFYVEDSLVKEVVVFYGNCHMINLSDLLLKSANFREVYYICKTLPVYEIEDVSYFDNTIFKICDIFIHQSIRRDNKYGELFASENIIRKLKKGCKVIAVPNVYHMPMCYYPQYMEKTELKGKLGNTIFFRDNIIEQGIKSNKSRKRIVDDYINKKNIYSFEDINHQWKDYIDKIKKREVEWDIKLSEYIEKNKTGVRMYYDPNHPMDFIIKHIGIELCKILNIENDLEDKRCANMDTYEIPLVRDVIDYFKFDYSLRDYELRKTGSKLYVERMYIKEYVNQYTALLWQDHDYSLLTRCVSYFRFFIYKCKRIINNRIIRRKR